MLELLPVVWGAVGWVAGGIVGNRSDQLFCDVFKRGVEGLNGGPKNHDLLKSVEKAHYRALDALSGITEKRGHTTLAQNLHILSTHRMENLGELAVALNGAIGPIIADAGDHDPSARQAKLTARARSVLITHLETMGTPVPPDAADLFEDGQANGQPGWQALFRLYLSEEIKTNPRTLAIFTASGIAAIDDRTIRIGDHLVEIETIITTIAGKTDAILAGQREDRARDTLHQQRTEAQLQQILDAVIATPAGRAATAAGIQQRAFILLARKINVEVEDDQQALSELTRAIEELVDLKRQAAHGTNLDTLVDEALRRMADRAARGEFDAAADEGARAFAEWERREDERRERERQAGITLADANVRQQILRRDPTRAAQWIEKRVALEAGTRQAPFGALDQEWDIWFERGRDKGSNLDLEIAISIARGVIARPDVSTERQTYWNNSLGTALQTLGERESGTAHLEEAVLAYRAVLEEWTRDRVPLDWAATQNNLGAALQALGERESSTERLEEAVLAYREALEEWTRDRVPLDWAVAQNNLGTALQVLGWRESDTTCLEEAVLAYRTALEEWTRDRVPLDWAMAQNNLGTALQALGERESGTARLEEAVLAYREALGERTRDRVPLDWATTQNNLGSALVALGGRESGTVRLEEAVLACRAALEEWTRDRVPLNWALAQNNLGSALRAFGERESGTARLEEAVLAYREALEERTRDRVPLDWAMTQDNLGSALIALGGRESGTARLEEAVLAYRAALEEWTRDRVPLNWARSELGCILAEAYIAERRGQVVILSDLKMRANIARSVIKPADHIPLLQFADYVLAELERINARLS